MINRMNSTVGICWLALAVSPGSALAENTPNLFTLQGGGVKINYSTSGFDGKPHFTYQTSSQTLNFSGSQIRTASTELGTLVTVSITITVDSGSTSFTVLVPHVNLGHNFSSHLSSQGIITRHKLAPLPGLPLV
jgi:hypothetical protein